MLINVDKVFYFVIGIIKFDIFDYYVGVVEVMFGYIVGWLVMCKCWFNGVD